MGKTAVRILFSALLISMPLLGACSDDDVDASGHDVNKSGVMHKAGMENALANCTACHGAALRGGDGPSCYSCHSLPTSHTAIRNGVAHNAAPSVTCSACHGPNNMGGLGPACSTCHA